MQLSKNILKDINTLEVSKPTEQQLELPVKIIQFGTGVLLRGLVDFFVDKANRKGIFNGRVVVVKSTASGDSTAFNDQDNLYTICVRGVENEKTISETIICSAISRVLTASSEWNEILACAANHEIRIIVSNTTEVGLQYSDDNISAQPPVSFPGKLLAFLHERYKIFNGDPEAGMVVIPTELIVDNGNLLLSILIRLANYNKLEPAFIDWLTKHNTFCNSLVDRIVPGAPPEPMRAELEQSLGYSDRLMLICESYRLWAIEGDKRVEDILSFSKIDEGVIVAPNIESYRELKLRMLNATHTLTSGLAFLSGFETVKQAMKDPHFSRFVESLMLDEIGVAIPCQLAEGAAEKFGRQTLDRFRNPFLEHKWISITLQYTAKIKMRVIPVLLNYHKLYNKVPERISTGFAAYILFMKPVKMEEGKYYGEWNGKSYPINDDSAAWFYEVWNNQPLEKMVRLVLSNVEFWGFDLSIIPGFEEEVLKHAHSLKNQSVSQPYL
jgi:tagaturonate reductase